MKTYDPVEIKQTYVEDAAVLKFLHETGRINPGHKMIIAMLWRIAKALENK
jgi:hypothetical protein